MASDHPAVVTAQKILSDRYKFCKLMAQAREFRIPGWWDGSAYRSHPCGFHADGLIFENSWHVDDYCNIRAMKCPSEPLGRWCHDSWSYGCPRPTPPSGTVTVWSNGKWVLEGPWVAKSECIIAGVAMAVSTAKAARRLAEVCRQEAGRILRDAELSALSHAHGDSDGE